MGPIAVAAYSYMSLVPIIQPPIMKAFTTEEERKIKMDQLRPVSKLEKILFPIIITIVVCTILPTTAPLVGMLMLGNLFRECGVTKQLAETCSNAMMYIVVILLGTSVGASTSAEAFLNVSTLKIVVLGLAAFCFGTFGGIMLGKLMCKLSHQKINPLIGSAGVSAVPMAARVSQKVGAEADPTNFLLMHAMGPNVAGVIGTAVAAGTFMAIFGVGIGLKIQFLAFGIFVYLLPAIVQRIDEIKTDDHLKAVKQTMVTLNASTWQMMKHFYIPSVLSRFFPDIINLVAVSWTYIIIAELLNAQGGLGYLIYLATNRQNHIEQVYAIIILIIVIGIIQDYLLKALDRKLFKFKYA